MDMSDDDEGFATLGSRIPEFNQVHIFCALRELSNLVRRGPLGADEVIFVEKVLERLREVVEDLEAHNMIAIVEYVGLLGVVPQPTVSRAILERAVQVAKKFTPQV
ncbi:hypothetical protein T484DRAFT_1905283 [Baffinella frigidus]|nr:hypothetical protein T484DRAFT_1905283 [Cryptophyta sp. CCMP2293]